MTLQQMEAQFTDLSGKVEGHDSGISDLAGQLASLATRVGVIEDKPPGDSIAVPNTYFITNTGETKKEDTGVKPEYTEPAASGRKTETENVVAEDTFVVLDVPFAATALGNCELLVGGVVLFEGLPELTEVAGTAAHYLLSFIVPAGKGWRWNFGLGGKILLGVKYLGLP